jgi:hypothetical protein
MLKIKKKKPEYLLMEYEKPVRYNTLHFTRFIISKKLDTLKRIFRGNQRIVTRRHGRTDSETTDIIYRLT